MKSSGNIITSLNDCWKVIQWAENSMQFNNEGRERFLHSHEAHTSMQWTYKLNNF